jgi:hypothetical protein
MRDINVQPQSWTVDYEGEDGGAEPGETEDATGSFSFSYARV